MRFPRSHPIERDRLRSAVRCLPMSGTAAALDGSATPCLPTTSSTARSQTADIRRQTPCSTNEIENGAVGTRRPLGRRDGPRLLTTLARRRVDAARRVARTAARSPTPTSPTACVGANRSRTARSPAPRCSTTAGRRRPRAAGPATNAVAGRDRDRRGRGDRDPERLDRRRRDRRLRAHQPGRRGPVRGGQRHGRARQPQRRRDRDEGRRLGAGQYEVDFGRNIARARRGHDRASPARARRLRARSTSPTAPATPRRCSSTRTPAPGGCGPRVPPGGGLLGATRRAPRISRP